MLAEGSGPPVLLLHGSGPGSTAAAWAPLIAALAPRHRVIAPDLRDRVIVIATKRRDAS